MLQHLGLLTCCVVVGWLAAATETMALPPKVGSSGVAPVVISFPSLPDNLQAEPDPPTFNFDLPNSDPGNRQPWYQDDPLKPAELPLRLEIKLSQRRVIMYRGGTQVKAYAIAVGRPGWETPKGTFQVRQMFRNPAWVHPLKKGVAIAGGDPENPLGRYWIGFWTDGKNWIGFHGTPNPTSVGTAASHGCIRMYNNDIEELFQKVSVGTEVKVVQ